MTTARNAKTTAAKTTARKRGAKTANAKTTARKRGAKASIVTDPIAAAKVTMMEASAAVDAVRDRLRAIRDERDTLRASLPALIERARAAEDALGALRRAADADAVPDRLAGIDRPTQDGAILRYAEARRNVWTVEGWIQHAVTECGIPRPSAQSAPARLAAAGRIHPEDPKKKNGRYLPGVYAPGSPHPNAEK